MGIKKKTKPSHLVSVGVEGVREECLEGKEGWKRRCENDAILFQLIFLKKWQF